MLASQLHLYVLLSFVVHVQSEEEEMTYLIIFVLSHLICQAHCLQLDNVYGAWETLDTFLAALE